VQSKNTSCTTGGMSTKPQKNSYEWIIATCEKHAQKDIFQEKVLALRYISRIPKNGFNSTEEETKWKSRTWKKVRDEFSKGIKELSQMCEIPLIRFEEIIMNYIFHGKFEMDESIETALVNIRDIPFNNYLLENSPTQKEISKSEDAFFPIALMIHPRATSNDLKRFINNYYKSHIQPLQKKYEKENALLNRLKPRQELQIQIEKYVRKHISKSNKLLAEEVSKEFKKAMSPNEISKIKARLKKANQ